jgi:16S rRNA (guanine527-N7)-methyltransferase
MTSEEPESAAEQLNRLLVEADLEPLGAKLTDQFEDYISLFIRWNSRINLSSVRDQRGIISRHIIESIDVARVLPESISTLLDFGSGGGLPGIPIALCRPEIQVTLAESQTKKAAFLQEAARTLRMPLEVYADRGETIGRQFDCATLRAVDRMAEAVCGAGALVRPGGWLALMTTEKDLAGLQAAAGPAFHWREPHALPGGETRILVLGTQS